MKLNRKSNILSLSTLVLSGALAIACGGGSDGSSVGDSGDGDGDMSGDGDGDEAETGDGDTSGDGDMTSGDGDMGAMGGSPGDEPLEAATPSVVSTNIEDGAAGVAPDASIVIEFSRPMDRKSVEDAYSSESLPSDAVEFEWNDDWTVLTIRPLEELKFATHWQIDNLEDAVAYDLLIGKTAVSADGDNLGHSLSIGFTTARQMWALLDATGSFTGHVRSDGADSGTIFSGDSVFDDVSGKAGVMGTMTFNLDIVEEAITSVEMAIVGFDRFVYNDSAPESLMEPVLYTVDADTRSWDAVRPQIIGDNAIGETVHDQNDHYFVDVTDMLLGEIEGDSLAQFALAHPEKTNGDDQADMYRYEDAQMLVLYWLD